MDGFIFVNKPAGPSSYAVINQLKHFVKHKRIGHAGTLDPAASGLLIVAIGKATRLLEYLPAEPKSYSFTLRFGAETDTLDNDGTVVESGGRVPDRQDIVSVLPRFIGTILQEPPRFSAIKINGKRAYARARKNEPFIIKPRNVTIASLALENFDVVNGAAHLAVSCSSGTYIRSLARDIARELGAYGFASDIRRTAIGPFSLEEAKGIDTVVAAVSSHVVSIQNIFRGCACVTITEGQKEKLSFGADISIESDPDSDQPVFAFDGRHEIVAVLVKKENGMYHPEKVFL